MQLAKLGGSHDWDKMAFTMSDVSREPLWQGTGD